MSDTDVNVKFGAETASATSAITELREVLQGLISPIRGIRSNLGEVAEAFAAAFAVEKIAEFVEGMAHLGTETARTAAMLGITTEEVGKLNAISLATGSSAESMTMMFERLSLSLQRAAQGTGPQAAALKVLGLNAKALIDMPLPAALDAIANKFAGFADGPTKTAAAMALLGRSGAQAIPVLDQGAEGLEELAAMAERSGTALDEGTVASLEKLHHGLVEFGLSIKGVSVSIMSVFTPSVQGLIQILIDLVENFNGAMKSGGLLADAFGLIGIAAKVLITAFAALMDGLQQIWAAGTVLIDDLGHAFIGLGKAVYDAMHGNFSAIAGDIKGIASGSAETMKTYLATVASLNKQYADQVSKTWASAQIGPHDEGHGEKPKVGQMDLNDQGSNSATKMIDAQIKALQLGLAQKKLILDQEVANKQITENQKYAALEAETDKEYEAEKALLTKQMGLWQAGTTQYATAKGKLLELDVKHNNDMIKLDTQSMAAETKLWQGYLTSVQTAWDGQLRGLLAGTTSFKDAMKNIFGDLIIAVIQHFEKLGIEWAAAQLGMTTASTTGAAARVAADQAATTATLPARAMKFTSDIMADAAATFAGIFASMAPILGPAAAGPAAAGQATVLAELANVPKFDVGTPYIMKTGLAMVHEGEKITPAQGSGPWTGESGGGDTHHWHINAVDGASVLRMFQTHGDAINRILGTKGKLSGARA